jgi:7,8-dihydropterin-6-yl-methyl-4-(beta-D-ribofuranosyl)aminobenzene 5'-phosphate synthase
MGLFVGSLTGCTAVTPTPLVTETPPTQIHTPVAQRAAPETAPMAMGDLKLTILFDNTIIDSRFKSDWRFAALVEYSGHTLLFDTGTNGSILLGNMRQLSVGPQSIEVVILSHEHYDHTGGLLSLLDTGIRPTVYTPSTFSNTPW